jgi:putative sigma-54 modulation protein
MKVIIQSLHFTASEALKGYIQKKCDKLDQFYDRILDGHITLKVQQEVKNANKRVDVQLNVPGENLIAGEQGSSFEEATDLVMEKLKAQLKKHKEKLRTI